MKNVKRKQEIKVFEIRIYYLFYYAWFTKYYVTIKLLFMKITDLFMENSILLNNEIIVLIH